jgi:hypothetical protein
VGQALDRDYFVAAPMRLALLTCWTVPCKIMNANPGRSGKCRHGERAGRVKTAKAPEGSLEAPKRFWIILNRSDRIVQPF